MVCHACAVLEAHRTGCPKFYGLPKLHKHDIPLRPIVSSTGTVSYNTSKELANILKPLVGWISHHLKNTKDFIDQIKDVRLLPDETIISYDIKALFTSVPIKPVIDIIKTKLENDNNLKSRTSMSIDHIISLLEYCLNSAHFVFQGQHYEQQEGAAMGSPLSPIIANLYMENFETKALNTAPNPPTLWKRYVDDTFVVIKKCHQEEFFHHINSIEESIQFTAEDTHADGTLPFLDVLVIPQPDGSLATMCIENLPIQDNTSNGIAIMPYLQSTVSSVLCFTGQKKYVHQINIW